MTLTSIGSRPGTCRSPGASAGRLRTFSMSKTYCQLLPIWAIWRPLTSGTGALDGLRRAASISASKAARNSARMPGRSVLSCSMDPRWRVNIASHHRAAPMICGPDIFGLGYSTSASWQWARPPAPKATVYPIPLRNQPFQCGTRNLRNSGDRHFRPPHPAACPDPSGFPPAASTAGLRPPGLAACRVRGLEA